MKSEGITFSFYCIQMKLSRKLNWCRMKSNEVKWHQIAILTSEWNDLKNQMNPQKSNEPNWNSIKSNDIKWSKWHHILAFALNWTHQIKINEIGWNQMKSNDIKIS